MKTNFSGIAARILPAATVAVLALSAIYIKPTAKAINVAVPAIQARDRYYGAANPAPHTIFLVGSFGKVIRSDDDGKNWTIQPTPTTQDLQDIHAWDADHAVAVGDDGVVLVTDNGGTDWTAINAKQTLQGTKLLRLAERPGGELWVVGEEGLLARSSDHGRNWRRIGAAQEATLNGIAFPDAENGFAIGEFGTVFRTVDGGRSWTKESVPTDRSLMSIAFRDDRVGVAVGLDGTVIATTDGGANWGRLPDPANEHLFGVAWIDEGWLAVGDKGVVLQGNATNISGVHKPGEIGSTWRVGVVPMPDGLIAVGAEPGLIEGSLWKPFENEHRG